MKVLCGSFLNGECAITDCAGATPHEPRGRCRVEGMTCLELPKAPCREEAMKVIKVHVWAQDHGVVFKAKKEGVENHAEVVKIMRNARERFPDRKPANGFPCVEIVEMTEEEYVSIPATNESYELTR